MSNHYVFFGYEPISNRFKVISILKTKNRCEQQCWILTVGDDGSWRKIQDIPYRLLGVYLEPEPLGRCVNGVLYYYVRSNKVDDETPIERLVSFDLKTEKFNLIKLPLGTYKAPGLMDFRGNLAFLQRLRNTSDILISVLENAEKHEWSSRTYKLPLSSLNLELKQLQLLGICEQEIVFIQPEADDPRFLFYFDFEKKTIRKLKIDMPPTSSWAYYSVTLIDNLVLL